MYHELILFVPFDKCNAEITFQILLVLVDQTGWTNE